MKQKRQIIFFIILVFLGICSIAYGETLLITNKSVIDRSIRKGDIKRIFLGKKKHWKDGSSIKVVTLKTGARHKDFMETYVNKTPYSFSAFWKRALVTGTGIPPKSFKTEKELLKFVSERQGAVGYISSPLPPSNADVKVLTIDK